MPSKLFQKMKTLHLKPSAVHGLVLYYPRNADALNLLAKGRKTFRGEEVAKLLEDGNRVLIDLNQSLGGEPVFCELSAFNSAFNSKN